MSYYSEIEQSVKPYQPGDKDALRAFQRQFFGASSRQSDDAFAQWLFEQNPSSLNSQASLWICKRNGAVVGQQASISMILKVGNAEHRAGWVVDWMIDSAWRLKGVAPALSAAYKAHTEIMLGLGVHDGVYRTFLRDGWKDVAQLTMFVRPLDPPACAAGLHAPKGLAKITPRLLARASARIVGRVAAMISGLRLEPIDEFDERVNEVWAAAGSDYGVLSKRDFTRLKWRFEDSPERNLFHRYYLMRKNAVVGYAVIRYEKWHGYTVARVVDYFTQRSRVLPLLALLVEALEKRHIVAVFIDHLNTRVNSSLWSIGFLRVRPTLRLMFNLRQPAPELADALSRADDWFVTPADGDHDHVVLALSHELYGALEPRS